MSGEDFEDYIALLLKRLGYKDVRLTKRSQDYGIDLLARKKNELYAFQCKYYSKPVGVAAVQQVYAGKDFYGADYAVVVTNNTFTRQAINLSLNNDVILWGEEELKGFIKRANSRSLLKRHKEEKAPSEYERELELFYSEGYASIDVLMNAFQYTRHKAKYILEDLEFHNIVSIEDEFGIRDLEYETLSEALDILR